MATIDPETRRNPSHAEEDSNYLYHKQPRGIPRRHSGSHRNEDDANRRFTERNVARETFWRNIRTFAFMILAMLVFLGLAFHISRKNWADKQTRIRQQGQVAQVSTAHPTVLNLTPRGTPPPVREAMPQEPTEAVKTKAELVLKRARAFELSGNYEEAIERYRQAVVLWNAIPGGWTELARAHAHEQQLSQARDAYVQALQYEPGNTALINELAMIYLQHGQTAKAITTLSQAIESDPLYVQSYINLSLCHLSMRDMKEAEEVLTACVDRFPDNAQALKDLAYIKASNGDYNTAL
ncbi:MAG: tetratricopeptide repeat protein, partial [Spartobacteria bacterium]|nr:tetratricopeptide repeat protein [Spartobacteria bacterium]